MFFNLNSSVASETSPNQTMGYYNTLKQSATQSVSQLPTIDPKAVEVLTIIGKGDK